MNECAVLGSRERHHSACQAASLCEHWELHNTSVCHHVCCYICDFSMEHFWSREQTSNSAWNSANLEGRLFKWDDVRMEMRPWVEDEAAAKGSPLWQSGGDPAGIAECSWYASRTGLPARVSALATPLGSMCCCTRGLFWRECCPNLNQVNTF